MLKQSTDTVLMIRPIQFAFNTQTEESNAFQHKEHGLEADEINRLAIQEFDDFVQLLKNNNIKVIVINDTVSPATPDSIFPNNWISIDQHARIIIYPMFAENRRREKREDIIAYLENEYRIKEVKNYSDYEIKNKFLEGTGSMVIDYVNNIAYACLSPRTHIELFAHFCKDMGYKAISFTALDANKKEIYHTNVMMCIASKFVVICLESIHNKDEREIVETSFKKTGHTIIDISYEQMNHFAGNMLEVQNEDGTLFLVMSEQAYNALTDDQIKLIEKHNTILKTPTPTIETVGGGGVRCMLAEVFHK
jgi:hypothetical protein